MYGTPTGGRTETSSRGCSDTTHFKRYAFNIPVAMYCSNNDIRLRGSSQRNSALLNRHFDVRLQEKQEAVRDYSSLECCTGEIMSLQLIMALSSSFAKG